MQKEKIRLTSEKETLLVPLFSKAVGSERMHQIIHDPKARDILARIDYDFKELKIPRQTLVTLAMRAKKTDAYVTEYLRRSDNPLVLHLGCGLDSRVIRVGFGKGYWCDVDYPDVIELRLNFYEESPVYHMLGSSVTDWAWMDSIPATDAPACIVAEGLLMYLLEDDVKHLFIELQKRLPGSEVIFDAYSRLAAKGANRHPSIQKTGARIQWGIDDARLIEKWGLGMKLLEEWYFTDSEAISSLGIKDRMLFKAMGMFSMARRAHRLLRVRL